MRISRLAWMNWNFLNWVISLRKLVAFSRRGALKLL